MQCQFHESTAVRTIRNNLLLYDTSVEAVEDALKTHTFTQYAQTITPATRQL